VIHYTAALDLIDGDPGESWDRLDDYIRGIQFSYAKPVSQGGRGYSIGYNVLVDQRGVKWEGRGTRFECAANVSINERSIAILVLVDGQDGASWEAIESVREVVAQIRVYAPRAIIVPHSSVGSTACPGAGLRGQTAMGVFEPVIPEPEPEPVPPVDPPDDSLEEMKIVDYLKGLPGWIAFSLTGTHLAHVFDGNADAAYSRLGAKRVSVSRTELLALIRSNATTTASPFQGSYHDAELDSAWNAQRAV
jgi:hypothetical protein